VDFEGEIELVDIKWLKAHEQVKDKRVDKLKDMTLKWGGYTKPLLVDLVTGSILDGHHRHKVGIILNLKRLPAILCNYITDDDIKLEIWPDCGKDKITKEEVISMALSDNLFPAKTSRHLLSDNLPPIHISLKRLEKKDD
jgi:hypothetical protein